MNCITEMPSAYYSKSVPEYISYLVGRTADAMYAFQVRTFFSVRPMSVYSLRLNLLCCVSAYMSEWFDCLSPPAASLGDALACSESAAEHTINVIMRYLPSRARKSERRINISL